MQSQLECELEQTLDNVKQLLHELRIDARQEENSQYVNCCFRYRNNFSSPQSDADYWFVWSMVTGLDDDGNMVGIRFQSDKNGTIKIEQGRINQVTLGEIAIVKEFWLAWKEMQTQLTRLEAQAAAN